MLKAGVPLAVLSEGRFSREETEQDNEQQRTCFHNSSPPVAEVREVILHLLVLCASSLV